MFKSIQYKLTLLTFLLVAEVAAATWLVLTGRYVHAVVCGVAVAATILALHRHYRRFNQNLVFLLNTLDNGDYSFHFSEGRFSAREKEFNATLNRIKDVLANARKEVVENEKFLSLIIESVSTGVLILDDRGVVQRSNHSAQALFGLPVFTHVNQLRAVDEHLPDLFQGLQPGDNVQIAVPNEREVKQINLSVSHIRLKRGLMRVFTLNNIGNALENKETESWIRLIRVLTHEIMNSIAPVSSLSETLLFLYRDADSTPEQLRANTIEAFETIQTTASGLLTFVESYRQFTSIPRPRKERIEGRELIEQLVKLHEPALRQRGIALTWQAGEDAHLMADRNLLMRVLVNLLKNAMEAPLPYGGQAHPHPAGGAGRRLGHHRRGRQRQPHPRRRAGQHVHPFLHHQARRFGCRAERVTLHPAAARRHAAAPPFARRLHHLPHHAGGVRKSAIC